MIDRASGLPAGEETKRRSSELERVMGKVKRRNVKIIISRSSRDVASFSSDLSTFFSAKMRFSGN